MELPDPFENMGAQLVKEVSTKTNDVAGDGTTTATLLAQAMIHEGLKNLAAGANPIVVKKGMSKAVEAAVAEVKKQAKKVNGSSDIARVGAVSSGDEEIGKLIACSSTGAISPPIWSPILRRWRLSLMTPISSSPIRKSP